MRRIAAYLLCVTVLSLVVVGAASSARRMQPRVTVLGDSVITSLGYTTQARSLLGRNVDLHFLAVVCRRLVQQSCWNNGDRPPTTLDVIRTNGSGLGSTVVVESGYNEYVDQYAGDLDTVMKALVATGVDSVLWLTLHETRPDYAEMNQQIRAATARWPQLVVVDWNAASRDQPWFSDDGVHLNYQGTMGMARLLRKYVVTYACKGSCAHSRVGGP